MVARSTERDELARGFRTFAEQTRGSSPLYSALAPAIAGEPELLELLLAAPPAQRRPNLLFAAVHDLLLAGVEHPLARYYPSIQPDSAPPDAAAFEAFCELCRSHRDALYRTIATRHTQTNEVGRSAALLPALQRIAVEQPLALLELGASAGLNLLVDRFRYRYGQGRWIGPADSEVHVACEVRGHPPPLRRQPPRIGFRLGIDLRPLDPTDPADARWLMACVWPEHTRRMQLLRAALQLARRHPPRLVRADAALVLEQLADRVPKGLALCVFHTATMPYLSERQRAQCVAALERLGSRRALHWLSLEGHGEQAFGARLPFDRLYAPRPGERHTDTYGLVGYATWKDGRRQERVLARADMHGSWIEWLAPDW
ncbi:MAG: hypothetical protein KatS3mg102_1552 [Planctomycetota bacterium]|nr:MAG: hypothetical protein KatS3mg102_1552 [Planctomycetota bacterium]